MSTKQCVMCRNTKPTSEFHKDKRSKDGLFCYCKTCRRLRFKNEPLATTKRRLATTKAWRAVNKDRINANRRNNYQNDSLKNLSQKLMTTLTQGVYKGYGMRSCLNEIIGCSWVNLITKIGVFPGPGYHIGHICPRYQAQNEDELKKLFHWKNLRWERDVDNIHKSYLKTPDAELACIRLLGRQWISKVHDDV